MPSEELRQAEILDMDPVTPVEEVLVSKYAEDLAGQSERLDRMAERLITLELAIPGLFATVLKLVAGAKAMAPMNIFLTAAFFCWLAALVLTLLALLPRSWQVDERIMEKDSFAHEAPLGIRDYFQKTARHKRRLILPSALLLFIGICSAVLSIYY
ncbi:MAG: hypothetical protein WGN25_16865 [Candidatus Electrothrix sp. GW3-4]|uniref:hypothetical protein n=1 Tax=Candidatus Electrothrix sp. GW3-4 TaxID=3126740 RepID=UPI0030CB3C63